MSDLVNLELTSPYMEKPLCGKSSTCGMFTFGHEFQNAKKHIMNCQKIHTHTHTYIHTSMCVNYGSHVGKTLSFGNVKLIDVYSCLWL